MLHFHHSLLFYCSFSVYILKRENLLENFKRKSPVLPLRFLATLISPNEYRRKYETDNIIINKVV